MNDNPLKAYRDRHRLSQQALARKLDISRQMVSHLERGDRDFTGELAVKMERLLGIPRAIVRPDLFR